MKTLKTTLLISMLILLTTSCTDLTKDDLVPETNNIELTTTNTGLPGDGGNTQNGDSGINTGGGNNQDTGGGSDGGGDDGSKGN
ncbi:hypothetical protein [Tenacibaculum aiptasiae]|uniref:hypothetical protein n=1 Tax=Tenacibaculum aiptasiae TaxID=426481 RepID=UPI00232AA6E9|nr:hypothetical protein [Tenacibaculum aiptasiae]